MQTPLDTQMSVKGHKQYLRTAAARAECLVVDTHSVGTRLRSAIQKSGCNTLMLTAWPFDTNGMIYEQQLAGKQHVTSAKYAINLNGVRRVFFCTRTYRRLSWQYIRPSFEDQNNCLAYVQSTLTAYYSAFVALPCGILSQSICRSRIPNPR